MRELLERVKLVVEDYLFWIRSDFKKILFLVFLSQLILIPINFAIVYLINEPQVCQMVEDTISKAKLEKCTTFVYDLMKENVSCENRVLHYKNQSEQIIESCSEAIEKALQTCEKGE